MKIETAIQIRADQQKCFAAFTDLGAYSQRITAIKNVELLAGDQAALGTRFKETRLMFGKEASETMEFTVFEPSSRFVLDARSHGAHYVTTHDFEEANGVTTVRLQFESTPETLMSKLLAAVFFFMKGSMVKAFQSDLSDMKNSLES